MTGLLPDVLRDAIEGESTYAASESFALVAVVLLVFLMVQRELLRARSDVDEDPQGAVSALSVPLLAVVLMTIAARLAVLLA